ncbi:U3 snoRNA associated [Lasiodiplodia theobromae]|uniref:U3 snoRNA associated n=1 Tax=Lasiodiplodia theobromae TaxID=45133 RepID=UPI0015C33B4F|nr:U3 snoRNA associated [Lasiodiplodia theobromae]KAF4543144.1 U3 snoRNA associated [Lasiodiplodia theobromae]
MVTTRRGADTQSPQIGSVTRSARKRFIDDSAASTPTRNTKKRRSASADEQSSQEDTPKLDLAKDSDSSRSTPDLAASVSTPVRRSTRSRQPKSADSSQESGLETPTDTPKDDESVYGTPAGEDTPSVYATPATNLRPGLRGAACPCPPPSVTPKPRTVEDESEEATPKANAPDLAAMENDESKPSASTSTHIRFGSEDPPAIPEPVAEPAEEEVPSSTAEQEEEDSDDEAPEALTASSARDQARAAEEEAAKAVERQEAETKRKRQEREARLREQAIAAKKRKQEQVPKEIPADVASSATIQASDPSAILKPSKPTYDLHNLPALLPDDLLAAAPEVRPATPESGDESAEANSTARKEKVNNHLKFLDEKPAKDVKKGPVKVRVLEKGNKFLPPKVSTSGSRSVRDTWLQGRKMKEGKKGSFGGLERKKIGGGFLRK